MKKNKNSEGFIFENYFVNQRTNHGNNSWGVVAIFLAVCLLIILRHKVSCSLQGGEIVDYKPTYRVLSSGETYRVDSLESACVKKTTTGQKILFKI